MGAVLLRASYFIIIIVLGYIMRAVGVLKREDFVPLSRIVIRITLTASVIVSFNGREIDTTMLMLVLVGFGFDVLLMLIIGLMRRNSTAMDKAFHVLNITGCNIGNFVLPFVQSFLGPVSVMCVCLFDTGNSIICLGGGYGVACSIRDGNSRLDAKVILKALFRSVPFITYFSMTVLCLLHITLPAQFLDFVQIIANANAFLAMFMVGVGFKLAADSSNIRTMLRILGTRYAVGITLSLITFYLLPLPLEYRQALAIVFLSPISGSILAFNAELKSDYGLASAVNSMSILISICLILGALMLIL